MTAQEQVWIPEGTFIRRYRRRFVVDTELGQTVMLGRGRPLWTEFEGEVISAARQRHPRADVWTEHLEGDGSTYYTNGIGVVNRSGAFILVRP